MKPYLIAPIAIAGLITTAGTASIVSAEMNLFKSGQNVVAMLTSDRGYTTEFREVRGEASAVRQDLASDWKYEMDQSAEELRAQLAGLPAPETTIEATPVPTECEKDATACEKAALACEKEAAKADRAKASFRKVRIATITPEAIPSTPEPAQVALASYELKDLPTPPDSKGFTMFVSAKGAEPVVHMQGIPAESKEFRMVFDAKKFSTKEFAKGMSKFEWKALSADEIKKLKQFGVDVQVKGWAKDQVPQSITINPLQVAAAASKEGFAALNDNDKDEDVDLDITSK